MWRTICLIVCLPLIFAGCNFFGNLDTDEHPPGPSVTKLQAEEVAINIYKLARVTSIKLTPINKEDFTNFPEEAKYLTPIYYEVSGVDKYGKDCIVYISSNNMSHHFRKMD